MTTYYVRKDGNDTTGNGSTGTPWLTLHKALGTIADGVHTVLMGAGTYAENSLGNNYLQVYNARVNLLTVQPEVPGETVIITDTGSAVATVAVRSESGAMNYLFKNLTFTPSSAKSNGTIYLRNYACVGPSFIGCTINYTSALYGVSYGVSANNSTAALSGVLIEDCIFIESGEGSGYPIKLTASSTGTVDGITIRNCTALSTFGVSLDGVTNLLIDGGSFASSGANAYGVRLGVDGSTGLACSGTIQNATISSATGHAVLFGAGCNGVTIAGCTVTGGDQGVVFKEATNITVTNNNISGGSVNALYFKAATIATVSGNTIRNTQGNCLNVGANSTTTNKSGAINFNHNRLFGTGTAKLITWSGDTGDSGGGVCDYNIYDPKGSGKFGAVRADADVTTLAELQAAWAGYGDGSNDSHSALYAPKKSAGTALLLLMHRR